MQEPQSKIPRLNITIVESYVHVVQQYGDRTALIEGDRKVTHRELLYLSQKWATKIKACVTKKNQPIAVYLPKSVELVVSNIGIALCGNVYMNLDVKTPELRLGRIHQNISPALYITDSTHKGKLLDIGVDSAAILDISESGEAELSISDDHITDGLQGIIDTDPYCIINTSGSTGTPKGVVLNHRSFLDFYAWSVDMFAFDENTIMGSLSPAFFDIYSFELCLLLERGACLVIIPESLSAFPAKILQLIEGHAVNFLFWVPTIMVNIANMHILPQFKLDCLKLVWFAGEVFPSKQLAVWVEQLPHTQFVNMYGPIEITLDCLYYIVSPAHKADDPLPIGTPCRNTDVLILTDDNTEAENNEMGELCVRGSSLALGYYNDLERTASVFVQNPLNPCYPEHIYRTGDLVYKNDARLIMFVGRKDYQIKHLGYRIELSEIESAALGLSNVRNACTVYLAQSKEIVLFLEGDFSFDVKSIRLEMAKLLPKYMVPTRIVPLPTLPMNANGKIDRIALQNSLLGA